MANSPAPQGPRLDRRLLAFLGFLAVGFGGILAAVLYAVTVDQPWSTTNANQRESTSAAPRFARVSTREAGRAFRDDAIRPTEQETGPFVDLFGELALAIGEQDVDRFLRHVNRSALIEQVNRQGPSKPVTEEDARAAAELMLTRFIDNCPGAGEAEFEFRRIRRTEFDGQTGAVVYTRRKVFNWERTSRQCWWLRERNGLWEIFDVADIATGLRASTFVAECFPDKLSPKSMAALMEYLPLALDHRLADAWDELHSVSAASLPPTLEVYHSFLTVEATQRMPWRYAPAAIDGAFAKLQSRAPRMPALAGLRAAQLVEKNQFEEALTQVDCYTRTLGNDPQILLIQGRAFAGLSQFNDAEAAYRRALTDDPYSLENLVALAKLLPDDKSREIAAQFRRIPDSQNWFESLARELLAAEELIDLETVIAAQREQAQDDPNTDFYQGSVLRRRRQFAAAAECFAKAFPRVRDEAQLEYYVSEFIACMLADLNAEDAYGRAPLARHAFAEIANRLLYPGDYFDEFPDDSAYARAAQDEPGQQAKRHALYQSVASLHLLLEPDDPWLAYYDAALCALESRHDDAEAIYAETMKRSLDEQMTQSLRAARVFSLYQADRDEYAYRNVGPAAATFAQLAANCESAAQWDRLDKLVELHRGHAPLDPLLWYFSGISAKERGNLEQAIVALQNYVEAATHASADEAVAATAPSYRLHNARNALVRCLVKHARWDEAQDEIALLDNDWTAARLQLLVHAAHGELHAAETAMEKYREINGDSADIYGDVDLGPLLRSKSFTALREKYPEPKPSPSAQD